MRLVRYLQKRSFQVYKLHKPTRLKSQANNSWSRHSASTEASYRLALFLLSCKPFLTATLERRAMGLLSLILSLNDHSCLPVTHTLHRMRISGQCSMSSSQITHTTGTFPSFPTYSGLESFVIHVRHASCTLQRKRKGRQKNSKIAKDLLSSFQQ